MVDVSGKTRVGYDVRELIDVLESFLGFSNTHQAFLFGVGNLGGALLHDRGLSQYGLEIMAGFDVRPEVVGKSINGIPVYSMDDFSRLQMESPVPIGILTVPVEKAQQVADQIIGGGVRAIWNFTPFRINVSEHIVVQNTSIYAHLALMFNRLEQLT
jgi:redox-sensing transcriptional repressor